MVRALLTEMAQHITRPLLFPPSKKRNKEKENIKATLLNFDFQYLLAAFKGSLITWNHVRSAAESRND